MELFLNNSTYHFVVKPPHLERDFEELKDNTIRVMIGDVQNDAYQHQIKPFKKILDQNVVPSPSLSYFAINAILIKMKIISTRDIPLPRVPVASLL